MALNATEYKYIQLDEAGTAIIAGSSMKVVELITSHLAYGWSPEELHFQYPHISLSQVYSALAYYWDHQQAMDADMQHRLERVAAMKPEMPATIAAKLQSQGLLS